jgi:hypothetical protein
MKPAKHTFQTHAITTFEYGRTRENNSRIDYEFETTVWQWLINSYEFHAAQTRCQGELYMEQADTYLLLL